MKLSVSNIGWEAKYDQEIYTELNRLGFQGIEIAPTRIFGEKPYEKGNEAKEFCKKLWEKYGLKISSMQSIWYGRNEKIFASLKEREILIDYTKRAIDFAEKLECRNLVFGCPKNREMFSNMQEKIAIDFCSA